MPYSVVINTDKYKLAACDKKNWEPGTVNDFMVALNGWHTTEPNLKCVRWRIQMFQGHWPFGEDGYQEWFDQKKNKLKYMDRLCGFERTEYINPYGFKQGYFDVDKVLEQLKKEGKVQIPFKWVYDTRQYSKNLDGCYMEITKK